MLKIYGEVYTFDIQHDRIDITSKYSGMQEVHIEAKPEEDFSVFDLGPAIANDVLICCKTAYIGEFNYPNACLHIIQKAGNSIVLDIHLPRGNKSEPIDSGRIILTIRDYVNKYE